MAEIYGLADWSYEPDLGVHVPSCSKMRGLLRCGNGPLIGEQIESGDCGEDHSEPEVKAIGSWRNNAEMIADVAKLGYIEGNVLDCTYGYGTFWKVWRPAKLTACDLDPEKSPMGISVDFTDLSIFAEEQFDTVVFDPPYKLAGRTTHKVDERYGVHVPYASTAERHALMRAGAVECWSRLAVGGHLLVKCQDQVASGKVWWQTKMMTDHLAGEGAQLVDSFLLPSYRRQPEGRRQVHARRNYSTLLVFRKGRKK